jgi:undecaprenyl-diphosphatase
MDLVSFLQAFILSVVEGATEFIPVSSTGHLILFQNWLDFTGVKENAFIIFIQLGAILAVVWLYRKKFISLAVNWPRDAVSRQLIVNLVIATLPAAVIGLPTEAWIEKHFFKPIPVSLALIVGGVMILLVERWCRKPDIDSIDHIPIKKALGVGMIQVLAILFPGISRSGATIMGGMVMGLSRVAATEFSFFLAVPAMLGASLIKLITHRDVLSSADILLFGFGFIVSFVVSLFVIRALLSFVSAHSFNVFAWYRILFGLVLFACWSYVGGF